MKIPAKNLTPQTTTSATHGNGDLTTTTDRRNHREMQAGNTAVRTDLRRSPPQSVQQLALLDEIRDVLPRAVRQKRVAIAPDVSVRTIPMREPKAKKKTQSARSQRSTPSARPTQADETVGQTNNEPQTPQIEHWPVSSRTRSTQTAATAGQTDNQLHQANAPVRRPSI
ncbi:MAG: hypothetical protein ACI9ZF_002303 [Bradyrhizobium sp.]|jgi:hypothetical protein